jgi:Urocanase Rossmann-like domain
LTPDPIPSAALDFAVQVERLYLTLIQAAEPSVTAEPSLGGKLLYAGELVPHGRALLVAANIAGAASLAATADRAAQKQAIRDGVADFLVNSLDEALRILKNQIRKREAVAVCVAIAPQAVEREMLERGVLPDLLPRTQLPPAPPGEVLVIWTVTSAPAQWLPRLDALAIGCLGMSAAGPAGIAARWLRLAPRFLGRLAQTFRILHCHPDVAREFAKQAQSAVDCGEIAVEVQISVSGNQTVFRPPSKPATGPANSLTC